MRYPLLSYVLLLLLLLPQAALAEEPTAEPAAAPEFLVQSMQLLDLDGERISFVQPGQTFAVAMTIVSAEAQFEAAFGELLLWHEDQLLASSGQRVELDQGRAVVTASFQAPKDVERLVIEGAAGSGRPQAAGRRTVILVGDYLTRYEPQRLLVRAGSQVELFSGQQFPVQEHALVYQHFYGVHEGTRNIPYHHLIVGAHDVVVSTLHGQVVQIDVLKPQYVETMRVGIMDGSFASLEHNEVVLSSSTGLYVENARGQVLTRLTPGLPLRLTAAAGQVAVERDGVLVMETSERLFVHAAYGGLIRIDSFQRGGSSPFHPEYRGVFEITPAGADGIQVVNEVAMDEYLYQVLPSEMPASWHLEALKAQAVAARTYAVREALNSRYAHRGFHVDDSTASQVYNNQREAAKANQAIDATSPYILRSLDNDTVIHSMYHSSSAGVTARASQVWSTEDGRFPGHDYPYLQARSVLPQWELPAEWTEDTAAAFFQDQGLSGYDDMSPWFRWQLTLTGQQLSNTINHNLPLRWQAQPDFVLTRTDEGSFASLPIPEDGIGTIRHMEVVERGDGGNIMALDIYGTDGVIRVLKEFNIRFLIRPAAAFTGSDVTLRRVGSGTDLVNYSILPSAFMVFQLAYDDAGTVSGVTFHGGGNGHGVGMSQWAARSMAEDGLDYMHILQRFYQDVHLVPLQMEYR